MKKIATIVITALAFLTFTSTPHARGLGMSSSDAATLTKGMDKQKQHDKYKELSYFIFWTKRAEKK